MPTLVSYEGWWLQVAAGDYHVCGIRSDYSAWCWVRTRCPHPAARLLASHCVVPWVLRRVPLAPPHTPQGYNNKGQLGDGTIINRPAPGPVTVQKTWASVACGTSLSCAITSAGTPFCWGANGGQLGDGTASPDRSIPTQLKSTASWSSLTVGQLATCGVPGPAPVLALGAVSPPAPPLATGPNCWGSNANAQWGDGFTAGSDYAPGTSNTSAWKQLSMSEVMQCGIQSSTAGLFCWGTDASTYGLHGDGSTSAHYSPVRVATPPSQWSSVFVANDHVCRPSRCPPVVPAGVTVS